MRRFLRHKEGNVQLILMAVTAAVALSVSVLIVFPILGDIDSSTIDTTLATNVGRESANRSSYTPSANATEDITDNMETFYTVSPILIVILATVGIITAIMMIVKKK